MVTSADSRGKGHWARAEIFRLKADIFRLKAEATRWIQKLVS
jgi:hypothetical protein